GRPRQFWSSSFAVVSLPEATASGAVTVLDGLPPPASPVAVLGPPLTARSAPTPSVDVPPGLAGPGGLGGVCFGVGLRVGLSVRSSPPPPSPSPSPVLVLDFGGVVVVVVVGGWFVAGLTQQEGGGDADAEVPEATGVTALPIGLRGDGDQTVDLHRHIGGQIENAQIPSRPNRPQHNK